MKTQIMAINVQMQHVLSKQTFIKILQKASMKIWAHIMFDQKLL